MQREPDSGDSGVAGLASTCPAFLLRVDRALAVLEANQAAQERFGAAAAPGASLAGLFTEAEDHARLRAELEAGDRASWHLGVPLRDASGESVHVSLCVWRLPGDAGELGVMGQDLGDLVRDTGRLVQAEKLAGVGRIAAQLAHQLNTPLGSILLSAQAIEPELHGTDYEVDVAIVVEETRRCQRIVRRLQNFSRTPGAFDDRVNFCHLFHRVFQILGHSLEAAGVTLRFRIARGRYLVRGDPSELEHAIFALIENAMDASPRGSTIRVRMDVDYEAGSMTFRVQDQGPGLPAEAGERIFEAFFTTKPEGKGTGLGLCIARRIVTDHGGTLVAGDAPRGGAEFRVELPLAPILLRAYREDPASLEVRAIPFEVLQARARGEFGAGCETVGVLGADTWSRGGR